MDKNWRAINIINQNRKRKGEASTSGAAKTTRSEGPYFDDSDDSWMTELSDEPAPQGNVGTPANIEASGGDPDAAAVRGVGGGGQSYSGGGQALTHQNRMLGSGTRIYTINNVRTFQIPKMGNGFLVLPLWLFEFWIMTENFLLNESAQQIYKAPFQIMSMKLKVFLVNNISNELRALGGTSMTTQTLTSAPMCVSMFSSLNGAAQFLRLEPTPVRDSTQQHLNNGMTKALQDGYSVDRLGEENTPTGPNDCGHSKYLTMVNNADENYWIKPGNEIISKFQFQQKGPYNWLFANQPVIVRPNAVDQGANSKVYNVLKNTQNPINTNVNANSRLNVVNNVEDGIGTFYDPDTQSTTNFTGPITRAENYGVPEASCNMPVMAIHMVPLQRSVGDNCTVMEILGNIHVQTEMTFMQAPPQFQNMTTRGVTQNPDVTAEDVFTLNPIGLQRSGELYVRRLPQLTTAVTGGQLPANTLPYLRNVYPFAVPSMIGKQGTYYNNCRTSIV